MYRECEGRAEETYREKGKKIALTIFYKYYIDSK